MQSTFRPFATLHRRRAFLALTTAFLSLAMAAIACTANDTLFIQLTATPSPTITPTPFQGETKFKRGEFGVIVGVSDFSAVVLPPIPQPAPPDVSGVSTCFPTARVEILDISRNTSNPDDPMIYYQVACAGVPGWIAEYQLSRFVKFENAVIRTKDGQGAKVYKQPDVNSGEAGVCPEGTSVSIMSQTLTTARNPQNDLNIYVQVSCGAAFGYVLEPDLAKATQ